MKKYSNLIIGRKPVLEALENGVALDKIIMQHNVHGELIGDIIRAAKVVDVPIGRVPNEKLDSLSRTNHQGVMAWGAFVTYYKLQDIIDDLFAKGISPQFIMLDGVTDVRNVGAIARTALCFGIDAIVFSEKNNAAINEDAVKTSAGAVMQTVFCREKSNNTIIDIFKQNGFKIYASSLQATKNLTELNLNEPCVLVLGGEENGISEFVANACDDTFIIPMSAKFDSLNVSVATGIICNEAMKQRV